MSSIIEAITLNIILFCHVIFPTIARMNRFRFGVERVPFPFVRPVPTAVSEIIATLHDPPTTHPHPLLKKGYVYPFKTSSVNFQVTVSGSSRSSAPAIYFFHSQPALPYCRHTIFNCI